MFKPCHFNTHRPKCSLWPRGLMASPGTNPASGVTFFVCLYVSRWTIARQHHAVRFPCLATASGHVPSREYHHWPGRQGFPTQDYQWLQQVFSLVIFTATTSSSLFPLNPSRIGCLRGETGFHTLLQDLSFTCIA